MISRPDFEKKQILYIFTGDGEKISFKNDNIIVADGEGVIKHQSSCYRLLAVYIVGDISITSGLIKRAHKFGFAIFLMSTSMRLYQKLGYELEGNTVLHSKQYEYEDIKIAKHIIANKISNQRDAIKRLRIKSDKCGDRIKILDSYIDDLNDIDDLRSLLGKEGLSARVYFREIFSTADWKGRQPQIKRDYINSVLDIGYTILFNYVETMLHMFGFDIYRGVLHTDFYMRKSLVCDLMEPMRYIIDLQVRKSINYGQIKQSDFTVKNNRYELKWENSRYYTRLMMEPIMNRKEDIYLYVRDYYRCFMKNKCISDYPVFEVK